MDYDVVIVGGGPAGLTAGIYTQRAMLKTLLLERGVVGGQILVTDLIENYTGFPEVTGAELSQKLESHARKFGLEIRNEEVISVLEEEGFKLVKTNTHSYQAGAVIVASGTTPRRLGVPGEREFTGMGVSYCATCDGFFFRDKNVFVVGGGDSAITEALYLSKIASSVTVIHRRDKLRAEKILQERAFQNPKIGFIWDTVVEEIRGKDTVESLLVRNVKTGEKRALPADGVFIYIGLTANTDFVDVEKNNGFIVTNEKMETSTPGIFAAGDCRDTVLRQIATAVGDGAIAAVSAERYLEEEMGK